jgi:hypothetical protein
MKFLLGSSLISALVVAAVLLIAPGVATPTPGGLDARGGHHCWTNCAKYGAYRGKYHCHRAPCNRRDILRHRRHGH